MTPRALRVAVAIPVFNEEAGVGQLLSRLRAVLDRVPGGPHEIVLVDDGSTDRTLDLLAAEAKRDPCMVVIALSRNFGHQAALTAALDHVNGEVTIVMDGDLQDSPEIIPLFIEKYEEGFDVVYARRRRRKASWWLRLCYRLYYRSLARLSRLPIPLDAGDFSLVSARVVEQLRQAPERNRYLRGLRTWAGFRQTGIDVDRPVRTTGESKYTIGRLAELAFDGVFSFSVVPIRAATVLGAITIGVTSLYALFALVAKLFFEQSPRGFTALILVITFVSGVHLLFLGIIGEYVGRIYDETKGRPIYVVDRIIRTER